MDLHSTGFEEKGDELAFLEYIASEIGEESAVVLADFVWSQSSGSEITYLTSLASIAKSIAVNGKAAVMNALEEVRKLETTEVPSTDVASFARRVVEDAALTIRECSSKDIEKTTSKAWRIVIQRMRKMLVKKYPDVSREVIENAISVGCVWDKEAETFGIEPIKLIDAMRSGSSL